MLAAWSAGCRSPAAFRGSADKVAHDIVREAQGKALGRAGEFTVDRPSDTLRRRLMLEQNLPKADAASLGPDDVPRIPQWPDPSYGAPTNAPGSSNAPPSAAAGALRLTLLDALQVAARGSRQYQDEKEAVFLTALALDLERDAFRSTWTGQLESMLSTDGSGKERVSGIESSAAPGVKGRLMSGGAFSAGVGIDLVKLLTQDTKSALGVLADATLSMPLLRGAGRFVVTEPLTQAERNVVYAIYSFERFKHAFAVRIASEYLGVLQQVDQLKNARDNYERLIQSTRRARRLAEAGQLPAIQVDQAMQDELRARNRWISAKLGYERQLDAFKLTLGLPPDAALELDRGELDRQAERAASLVRNARQTTLSARTDAAAASGAPVVLAEPTREGAGRLEMAPGAAVRIALGNRLDLRTRVGQVLDAQRGVAVAADQLRADLTLLGRGTAGESRSLGSAGDGNASLNLGDGRYSAALKADLPIKRTAERNEYRASLVEFERSVRAVQELEDEIKLAVRDELRSLMENRETVVIQATAVEVARRRLDSTTMFLEAGRAQIRDVLEAEESLVSAQNALSAALISYRIGELQLQRDMGVLEIDEQNLWKEYVPANGQDEKR